MTPRRHAPPPLLAYVAMAVPLAAVAYVVVQLAYLAELQRAGLLAGDAGPAELLLRTLEVHALSFAVWLLIAAAASIGAHRVAHTLFARDLSLIELASSRHCAIPSPVCTTDAPSRSSSSGCKP